MLPVCMAMVGVVACARAVSVTVRITHVTTEETKAQHFVSFRRRFHTVEGDVSTSPILRWLAEKERRQRTEATNVATQTHKSI